MPIRRRRPERQPSLKLLVGCLAVFTLTVAIGLAWPQLQQASVRFTSGEAANVARVIDGDTFELTTGEHVRILNIDTAEMPPRARCAREAQLALQAKDSQCQIAKAVPAFRERAEKRTSCEPGTKRVRMTLWRVRRFRRNRGIEGFGNGSVSVEARGKRRRR